MLRTISTRTSQYTFNHLTATVARRFHTVGNSSATGAWKKVAAIGVAIGFTTTSLATIRGVHANDDTDEPTFNPNNPDTAISSTANSAFDLENFNFELFNNLLSQSINSTNKIKENEVVLFLGNTNSAKSTNLNYMASHEMVVRGYNPQNSRLSESPDPLHRPVLAVKGKATFPIGHSNAESKTLFVQAETTKEGLCLCDTPGFGETRGFEYELATAYNIYQASQLAKKVKGIVVMVPYNAFDVARADSFKNLAQTLGTFLTNPEECKESIFFIITRTGLIPPWRSWNPFRWKVETFSKELIVGELSELSRDLSGSKDNSKVAAKKIVDFMIKNKNNIISDFDPLDNGQSRSALTKKLKECPGIDKTKFSPNLIGGNKRLIFQDLAISRFKTGSETLDLQRKIIESSDKQKKYEFDLAEASREEILDKKQLEQQNNALLEELNHAKGKKISLEKEIDKKNIDTPVIHWEDRWQSDAWCVKDFFSDRSHHFQYNGIPFIAHIHADNSRYGLWGRTRRRTNELTDKTIRAAATAAQGIPYYIHSGLAIPLSSIPDCVLSARKTNAILKNLDHTAKRVEKMLDKLAANPEKMHPFQEFPPVTLQVTLEEPELGKLEAVASIETNGTVADVYMATCVKNKDKPDIKSEIELLRTELDSEEKKIKKLEKSHQNLTVVSDKAKMIDYLISKITEEARANESYKKELEISGLNNAELKDIYQLAQAINHLDLNMEAGLPDYYINKYNERFPQ